MAKQQIISATIVFLTSITLHSTANATSLSLKIACKEDYRAYCAKHDADSVGAKQCMRKNGRKLSQRCIDALIDEGHVTKAYIAKHKKRP